MATQIGTFDESGEPAFPQMGQQMLPKTGKVATGALPPPPGGAPAGGIVNSSKMGDPTGNDWLSQAGQMPPTTGSGYDGSGINPQKTGAPAPTGGGMASFGTSTPSREQLQQYAQSRGKSFSDSSLGYWGNPEKWSELVARGKQLDPSSDGTGYANKFLSNAEEFTGGPQQTAMAMWGTPNPGRAGGGFGGSGWSPDPRTNELYDMLKSRAGQSLNVNRHDPLVANQVDSFEAANTRSMRNNINDLAERGGGTANLNLERRMGAERVGQDTAQFQGQIMQNEVNARRQEIAQALSGMGGLLSDQQKMSLQNELALMDNMLGRDTLGQRAYEYDTTNQRTYQGF